MHGPNVGAGVIGFVIFGVVVGGFCVVGLLVTVGKAVTAAVTVGEGDGDNEVDCGVVITGA